MQFKNISGKKINVQSKPVEPDEVIDVENDSEIKKLVFHKYLEKV